MSTSIAAASIVLSAGTYLADFASNIVVVAEYARPYSRFLAKKRRGDCNSRCRYLTSELSVYFWCMIGFLVLSHTLNVLIFKFKFKKEDGPYRFAYFLPLIHLWRLVSLVWRTLSCQGVENLRSPYMVGLFNIIATSLEGLPLLTIQFLGYLIVGARDNLLPHMSAVFKISIAASFASATYNGGSSVESVADNARTLKDKISVFICSGLSTLFMSATRCVTVVNIVIHMGDYFDESRPVEKRTKLYGSDSLVFVIGLACLSGYGVYYWLAFRPKQGGLTLKGSLTCLVFGVSSVLLGPLYAMVNQAREVGELGGFSFQAKLFIISMLSISVDLGIMCVTYVFGTLPAGYMFVSVAAAVGYIASTVWYICLDRHCGPVSQIQEISQIQEVDHVDTEFDFVFKEMDVSGLLL